MGDNERALFETIGKADRIEVCLNFSQSPSVGVLVEVPAGTAATMAAEARSKSLKAGVYSDTARGIEWLHKVLNIKGV